MTGRFREQLTGRRNRFLHERAFELQHWHPWSHLRFIHVDLGRDENASFLSIQNAACNLDFRMPVGASEADSGSHDQVSKSERTRKE